MSIRTPRRKYFVFLLLAVVALLAYANTVTMPFQFDDGYVVNNPIIRTFHYLLYSIRHCRTQQTFPNRFPCRLALCFHDPHPGLFLPGNK